jgi:hypothetical protein
VTSDPRAAGDAASRALAIAVRVLPRHRRDWGLAMQSELAAIEDVAARRRHALGCTRAVLTDAVTMRTVAVHAIALTFGAVALALAIAIRSVGVRIEAIAFVVILAALSWLGRRDGMLGPVGDSRLARGIRGGGCAAVGSCIVMVLSSLGLNDPGGWWIAALTVTLYLATVLFATARRTAAAAPTLKLSAALVTAGLTAWWVPMLLLGSVRGHAEWALVSTTATIGLGWAIGTRLGWPRHQVGLAGLGAGVATCMLIFLAAIATYAVFPQLVPDVAGPTDAGGLTPAARAETNRVESTDPYVVELMLGALLGGLLMVGSGPTRPRGTRPRRCAVDGPRPPSCGG